MTDQRQFLDAIARLERQYGIGDQANPTSAHLPSWRRLVVEPSGRWVTPRLEDQHGDLPSGDVFLFPSSASEPSIWMKTTGFGPELEQRYRRKEQHAVTLHLRGFQARRLAMQLLTMAEHFDHGGGFDPDLDEA